MPLKEKLLSQKREEFFFCFRNIDCFDETLFQVVNLIGASSQSLTNFRYLLLTISRPRIAITIKASYIERTAPSS